MVERGQVSAKDLVQMTPAELASKEVKLARSKGLQEDANARRLDWLEEHKAEIQKDLGIDPYNTWEFEDNDDRASEPDIEAPDI